MKSLRESFRPIGDYNKFSAMTGIPIPRLDRIFHGELPTLEELVAIAKATGTPVTKFMCDYDKHFLDYTFRNYEFKFKQFPVTVKEDNLELAFNSALKKLEKHLME